jgi:alpha-beta hydrolase superfamily lysophospholipase
VEITATRDLEDGVPSYLPLDPHPALVFVHLPRATPYRATGVLICPPFGWEEVCSYRARRTWAQTLARAGFPTVRLEVPGSGDSGGSPRSPGLLDLWTGAVHSTAEWLRAVSGCERIAAIGIGLGGLLACRAMASGAPIDDAILWSVSARGRTMLRELQAHAAIAMSPFADERAQQPPLPDGELELMGFTISSETASSLRRLDVTELELPNADQRHVLMLERDGLPVDDRLLGYFRAKGAAVEVAPSDDYDALVAHPQSARAPIKTIARTVAWLTERSGRSVREPDGEYLAQLSEREPTTELDRGGTRIRETVIDLETRVGRGVAILSEPTTGRLEPLTLALLDAGALRRIGPSRNWVEIARESAANGVATVRLDIAGVGDSDGDERLLVHDDALYEQERGAELKGFLDQLAGRGLPSRFALTGLCSGAFWALHGALLDQRVVAAVMVNLYTFLWSSELVAERARRDTVDVLRTGLIKRLTGKGITREEMGRALRSVRSGRIRVGGKGSIERQQQPIIDAMLDKLRDSATDATFVLSQGESLYEQFVREGRIEQLHRWPNMRIEQLATSDHLFRDLSAQQTVRTVLSAELARIRRVVESTDAVGA